MYSFVPIPYECTINFLVDKFFFTLFENVLMLTIAKTSYLMFNKLPFHLLLHNSNAYICLQKMFNFIKYVRKNLKWMLEN